MAVFQCEFHFWTMANQLKIPDDITGLCRYILKTDIADNFYSSEKTKFLESRDIRCRPSSKRPEKLKYTLNHLEKLLNEKKVLKIIWYSRNLLQIWTLDLACISVLVCDYTSDVERIHIDESIVQKLSSNNVADVASSKQYIIVCYTDKKTIDYIYFSKQRFDSNKLKNLASLLPSIHSLEIPSPTNSDIRRQFSTSLHNNLILFWLTIGSDSRSVSFIHDVPNMVLLSAGGVKLEIITTIKTNLNLVSATFSKIHSDIALCIEQNLNSNADSSCIITRYNFSRNQFLLVNTYSLNSLKEKIVCCDWANLEEKLIICDSNGGLCLYNSAINTIINAKCSIRPFKCEWHHGDTVFYICSKFLDLQIFDTALNPIKLCIKGLHNLNLEYSINISKIINSSSNFEIIESVYGPPINALNQQKVSECHDLVAFAYKTGPVVLMSSIFGIYGAGDVRPVNLITQYLRSGLHKEAVNLLRSQNWNSNPDETYNSLVFIFNHLIKLDFTLDNEELIQQTLGCFYLPTTSLQEIIPLQFKNYVDKLARRFFFYLLRNNRLEKAFLIATDISSRDLFMDLYHKAFDLKELALTDISLKKAKEISINENENRNGANDSPRSFDFDEKFDNLTSSDEEHDNRIESNLNKDYWSAEKPTMQALEYSLRNILKNDFTTHL